MLLNELATYPVAKTPNEWLRLQANCPVLTEWGYETLREGLDGHVATILREPHYICKDHRNLFSNFYSKKTQPGSPFCERLHFFSTPDVSAQEFSLYPQSYSEYYMGYSVIRPVAQRSLGRTVIDPYKVGRKYSDGFFSLRTGFKTHINGRVVTAHGYPYLSQDTDATVCAHATLWGVCRYLSERHSSYAELLPYDLVRLTAPTVGRVVPYRGMTYSDYSKILSDFGCHPVVFSTKEKSDDTVLKAEAFRDLYSYVESGLPVLASFRRHVIALIGHTLNYTREPNVNADGFADSSDFLDRFIVVDDNLFPYQLLGYSGDSANYGNQFASNGVAYDINSLRTGVCPLPEKVYLPADGARKLALNTLKQIIATYGRSAVGDPNEALVCRLFVTTGSSFKKRKLETAIAGTGRFDPLSAFVPSLALAHFVWVLEVSTLSGYKDRRCSAEIVLDATADALDKHALVYARFGATLILDNEASTKSAAPVTFPQFTHNLGEG